MRLLLLRNAITNKFGSKVNIILEMPYLPYARQDRICEKGEALSIRVFCDLINAQCFDQVRITDCHSDVALALLNNCHHTPQHVAMGMQITTNNRLSNADVLVIPDLGAAKKAEIIAKQYNLLTVQCMKTRIDRDTLVVKPIGKIPKGKLLVVDDICDGGGTFLALASAFEGKDLNLVVTHGIFSKGKGVLLTKYNNVEAVYDWTK
jgi:ribose-phosphate pyrophosphokinase